MLVATFRDRAGLLGDFWLAFRYTAPGYGYTQPEIHRDASRSEEEAKRWLDNMDEDYGEADERYIVYVHPANVEYIGVDGRGFGETPVEDVRGFIDRFPDIRKAITAICDAMSDNALKYVTLLGDKRN